MPRYGFHDGHITADSVTISGGLVVRESFQDVTGSSSATTCLVASAHVMYDGTAVYTCTVGTTLDYNRNVIMEKNSGAASRFTPVINITGKNTLGDDTTETITGGTAAAGRYAGAVAWSYIGTIVPAADYGTGAGTVSVYGGLKLGLNRKLPNQSAVLREMRSYGTATGGFNGYIKAFATTYTHIAGSATKAAYINIANNTINTSVREIPFGSAMEVTYLSEFMDDE